MTTKVGNTK